MFFFTQNLFFQPEDIDALLGSNTSDKPVFSTTSKGYFFNNAATLQQVYVSPSVCYTILT